MPQLVRSADRSMVMLLMPDGPSVERALQRVPIAALRVARNFQWWGISDLDEVAVAYRPAREPITTELIEVELNPKHLDGAAFLKLTQAPPLAQQRTKSVRRTRYLQAAFPHVASRSRKGVTDGGPAQVFEVTRRLTPRDQRGI